MPFDNTPPETKQDAPVVALLKRAKSVISTPNRWCKRSEHSGVRHCAIGAITSLLGYGEEINAALDHLNHAAPGGYVASYNDLPYTTHADIMRVYDKAIMLAERENVQ